MSDAHEAARQESPEAPSFHDPEGHIATAFIEAVVAALSAEDGDGLRRLTADLPPVDMAELLLTLPPDERPHLLILFGRTFDFAALTELDASIRARILDVLPRDLVVAGLGELDSDDAVYILEDLDRSEAEAILSELPMLDRIALQRSLDYPEESAGRLMRTDFVAVPAFWTVGQTIDYMRDSDRLPDDFYEVFIIDPGYRFLGAAPLSRILRARRAVKIRDLMEEDKHLVRVPQDREDVARIFERYNLVSAAVVDEADRLVGVITVDDVVDVIREETEEDLSRLAGVGDEELSDPVRRTVKSRFPWLFVNMGTALLSATVISFFEEEIARMVALAVLMPIVASMGGNAGTQTMAVAVRALATREISRSNVARLISREALVGLTNGVVFALIMGSVAGAWFHDAQLGLVIALAMITNLVAAALGGILIPLTLNRLGADPAVASGVFVTMVTDVVGFAAFLGFATWWYGF